GISQRQIVHGPAVGAHLGRQLEHAACPRLFVAEDRVGGTVRKCRLRVVRHGAQGTTRERARDSARRAPHVTPPRGHRGARSRTPSRFRPDLGDLSSRRAAPRGLARYTPAHATMDADNALSVHNLAFLEALQEAYEEDPNSVDPEWIPLLRDVSAQSDSSGRAG